MKMPKGFLCTAAAEGEVLQNEKAQAVLQNLDLAWLKQAAEVYCISPNVEDYVLVTTLITISDLPNRNGVAFPLEELIRFQEPPLNRLAFEGWRFCPCFWNHQNSDCTKAKGVVFDVSLRKVEGYNNDKLWKVVGVLGFDKTKDPELAHRIATGDINTYSMGALADFFTCSYCGAVISDKSHCTHINSVDDVNFREVVSYDGQSHVAFLNAHCISPIEVSAVEDPAWVPALSDTVIQGAEPAETETVTDDGKVEQTESVKFPKGFADWNPYGGH